jgi:hypothetical protein
MIDEKVQKGDRDKKWDSGANLEFALSKLSCTGVRVLPWENVKDKKPINL